MQLEQRVKDALEHLDVEHVALHVAVLGDGVQEVDHVVIPGSSKHVITAFKLGKTGAIRGTVDRY